MIKNLADKLSKALTADRSAADNAEQREAAIRTATAVLMTEIARADYEYDETEFSTLLELIAKHFQISPDEAAELADAANVTAEESVSVQGFTRLLNENLDEKEREHIVSLLWQVAYADGRLDKYEDSLVSRIADLLYVSRGRVMRLKHDADPDAED